MAESDFLGFVIVRRSDYIDLVRQLAEAETYSIGETSADFDKDFRELTAKCKRYLRKAGCNEDIVNSWFPWLEGEVE